MVSDTEVVGREYLKRLVDKVSAAQARADDAERLLREALVCLTTTFRDAGKRHDAAIAAIRAFLAGKENPDEPHAL